MPNEVDFYSIKNQLGALFYSNVGLFRDTISLDKALHQIQMYREQKSLMGITDKSKIYNTNLKEFLEFLNMLELGDTIILSALNRCESRGAHYRVDYPSENSDFAKDSVIIKIDNDYKVELV